MDLKLVSTWILFQIRYFLSIQEEQVFYLPLILLQCRIVTSTVITLENYCIMNSWIGTYRYLKEFWQFLWHSIVQSSFSEIKWKRWIDNDWTIVKCLTDFPIWPIFDFQMKCSQNKWNAAKILLQYKYTEESIWRKSRLLLFLPTFH